MGESPGGSPHPPKNGAPNGDLLVALMWMAGGLGGNRLVLPQTPGLVYSLGQRDNGELTRLMYPPPLVNYTRFPSCGF